MYIYIIELVVIWVLGLLLYCKRIKKKNFIIISMLVLTCVLGLRGNSVGEDTSHFIEVFHYISNLSWKDIFSSGFSVIYNTVFGAKLTVEIGYAVFNKLISIFTNNAQWVLIFSAIITNVLIGRFFYKNVSNVFLALYIYMCEAMYMQSFNLMRQFIAIAIALQAYDFLKEKKYFKGILIIFLASTFHTSAITMLCIIPILSIQDIKKVIKYVLITSIIICCSMPFISTIISTIIPKYAGYFSMNYWGYRVRGQALLWGVEAFVCLFMYHRIRKDHVLEKDSIMGVIGSILYLTFSFIGIRISSFQRIALYFNIFIIFLFTGALTQIKARDRLMIRLGLYMVMTFAFISSCNAPSRFYTFFWQ